ncbi:hypothetical protein RUND412_003965 [Rhizina undulata]
MPSSPLSSPPSTPGRRWRVEGSSMEIDLPSSPPFCGGALEETSGISRMWPSEMSICVSSLQINRSITPKRATTTPVRNPRCAIPSPEHSLFRRAGSAKKPIDARPQLSSDPPLPHGPQSPYRVHGERPLASHVRILYYGETDVAMPDAPPAPAISLWDLFQQVRNYISRPGLGNISGRVGGRGAMERGSDGEETIFRRFSLPSRGFLESHAKSDVTIPDASPCCTPRRAGDDDGEWTPRGKRRSDVFENMMSYHDEPFFDYEERSMLHSDYSILSDASSPVRGSGRKRRSAFEERYEEEEVARGLKRFMGVKGIPRTPPIRAETPRTSKFGGFS